MSFEADEELLEDFLIEAGEILEALSEQLVELENNPDDLDLLNAIFRGFHTIKGGAGFLGLENLVHVSHVTENIFDLLRNQQRSVTAELMDVILQALDSVNDMFENIKQREEPEAAPEQLIEQLNAFSVPEDQAETVQQETEPESESEPEPELAPDSGDMTDDDFEALLDQLHGKGGTPGQPDHKSPEKSAAMADEASTKASDSGDMTDEDFEALLDELHGKGGTPGHDNAQQPAKKELATADDSNSLMSDDDFDSLLDEIHGKGKGPTSGGNENTAKEMTSKPTTTAKAKPKSKTKPKPKADASATSKQPASNKAVSKVPTGETTVRVDTKRLDDIMNMVGELVLVRNRLNILQLNLHDEGLSQTAQNLDLVTGALQTAVMKTRMQPIKKVFGRFPRVVRDLARNLNKEVKLSLVGEETDLDKNLVEALADPLVHLVRNSVDHGIEMPEVRSKSGKDRVGNVTLSASQEGDHIQLSIVDDGGGMNAEVLRGLAVEKGIMDQEAADRLTDKDCYNLIFAPGFSTKKEISDVSGRGVGMDVVKTKITQLNGMIDIDSEMGVGTTISIKVPLTLAIMPTLMVVIAGQIFALPLASVSEIFHLDLSKTNTVDGQRTIIVREKAIPLFYLEHWLVRGADLSSTKEEGHVVIYQAGNKRVGFVVDSLLGQEEVVIKALGSSLSGTPGMAGATITSDGGIALILDVPSLLSHYSGHR